MVLVAARVQGSEGEDKRILARGKSNIGPDNGGFEYHLAQVEALPDIHASRIEWGTAVHGSAQELLTDPVAEGDGDQSAVDSAIGFLEQALSSGPTPSKTIERECKDAGVSWASVRRASEKIGVKKKKGEGSVWYWSLPMLLKPNVQDAHVSNLAHVEHLEQVEQVDIHTAAFHGDELTHVAHVAQLAHVSEVGQHGQVVEQVGELDDAEMF